MNEYGQDKVILNQNDFPIITNYCENLTAKEYITNPAIAREEEIKKTEPVLQEKQTTKAEEEPETTSHVKTESAKKITFCICLSLSIVLAIFLVLSTIFALLNVNNTRILSGI